MNEKIAAVFAQLKQLWGSLSNVKRLALVAGTAGVLVLVLVISSVANRESYAYLFTDLSADDAASIAAKLKELKVPYRIDAGGSAVQVPEERVHELRLELAGQGLPRGGSVGFEIFDKSHLGATEFEQRIQLRRALEGELARTIATIGSVHTARVHLVLPERSIFATNREAASASVVLRLRTGRAFAKSEVASVVHLVASAVPGLTEDRVSVVSADGLTLHRPLTDGALSGGDGEAQAEREREIATSLEDRARAILEKVVGAGRADVRIGVDLDTATRERTEEHYDPQKTALRSEQKTEERTASDGPTVAGVPGAASNLPDRGAEPSEAVGGGSGSRLSWTRNWEVDRVTEKTTTPAGKLARLSVAVLVDGKGEGNEFVPRDQAELDRLGALVKGAIGFNEGRGDAIHIESAPFRQVGTTDEPEPMGQPRRIPRWAWIAAGGAAAVVLAAAMILVLRRRRKSARDAIVVARAAAALRSAEPAAAALPIGDEHSREEARLKALEIAGRDPATAAIIVREWLSSPSSAQAQP